MKLLDRLLDKIADKAAEKVLSRMRQDRSSAIGFHRTEPEDLYEHQPHRTPDEA